MMQTTAVMRMFAAVLMLALGGCGGAKKVTLSGTVSYNGAAVEKGEISFVPIGSDEAAEGATIENGRYSLETTVGKKRVEIRGSRPLPAEKQTEPMGTLYEDFIPEKFNGQSTLTAEVTGSTRSLPFDLKD